MTEATGEHPQDTAEDQATTAPPRANAWTTYRAHCRGCSQCTRSVWRCPEGNELWNAYLYG